MSTVVEHRPDTATTPAPPARRGGGWRDLRLMLVTVAAVLGASAVAVVIAYAVKGGSGPAGDVQARTIDFKVLMPTTLGTGKHTIGLTNDGKAAHEVVLFKTALPADRMPLDAEGNVNEDSPLLQSFADSGDALKPGGTKSFATDALVPGHYVAVCNLPGHYRLGMRLNVTVR